MRTSMTVALSAVLAACASAPRVTTESERATATEALNTVVTGVLAARALEKITQADMVLVLAQVDALREEVAASEHTAIGWSELLHRAANLALQWALRPDPGAEQ